MSFVLWSDVCVVQMNVKWNIFIYNIWEALEERNLLLMSLQYYPNAWEKMVDVHDMTWELDMDNLLMQ